MIIAVDFDGVLCEKKWPDIGKPNRRMFKYLIRRKEKGDTLILWTCRCGQRLDDAIMFCLAHGLAFDYVNANVRENVEKFGNDSRKVFAHRYIDDQNVGTLFMLFHGIRRR